MICETVSFAAILSDSPFLIIVGGIYQLLVNKQICNLGLYGFCFGCQNGCTNTNYFLPCPNSIALNYQDASDVTHVTRFHRFNKDVAGFITGKSGVCDPIGLIGRPVHCPACPGTTLKHK